jgi:hypothetical protein
LAYIASATAIVAALALAFYVLIWACGVLILFIHAFTSVCQTAYIATGSTWVTEVISFILLLMLNIKIAFVLFPSLPAFFRKEDTRI